LPECGGEEKYLRVCQECNPDFCTSGTIVTNVSREHCIRILKFSDIHVLGSGKTVPYLIVSKMSKIGIILAFCGVYESA
jgi:hypothetical protein